ncbi:MAG: hypothetical protein IOB85_10965 [Methylobacterium sp.]|nr:hypothetical protein [Methylobacterium sp.]MCA3655985.1 hypothetical protein [Methylobacterium sp.]MCA3657580.1 hypothetical protein [Methylobacterium sp.]MCA3664158.1 hypothetical protein [Methylobacterium sp.]MCA3666140.1 hypothetical protein [Methylobacterium sp.]
MDARAKPWHDGEGGNWRWRASCRGDERVNHGNVIVQFFSFHFMNLIRFPGKNCFGKLLGSKARKSIAYATCLEKILQITPVATTRNTEIKEDAPNTGASPMPPLPDQKPPFLRLLRNIRLALWELNLIAISTLGLLALFGFQWFR